jgi:hypothetical protein
MNIRAMLVGPPYLSDCDEAPHTPLSLFKWTRKLRKEVAAKNNWREPELICAVAHDRQTIVEVAKRLGLDTTKLEN